MQGNRERTHANYVSRKKGRPIIYGVAKLSMEKRKEIGREVSGLNPDDLPKPIRHGVAPAMKANPSTHSGVQASQTLRAPRTDGWESVPKTISRAK